MPAESTARWSTQIPWVRAGTFMIMSVALVTCASAQKRAAIPRTPGPAATPAVARLIHDGAAALEHGDERSARDKFDRALRLDPRNVDAHTYLGVLDDRAGDSRRALRHFAAAVAAAPGSAAAHNNYGGALLRSGEGSRAAAEFTTSLKLQPSQLSAMVNLAQIRAQSDSAKGLKEAEALLQRAYAISPEAPIAQALLMVAARTGDTPVAEIAYTEYAAGVRSGALKATPAERTQVGAALLEAGLYPQALTELSEVVRTDPANPTAIVLLAQAQVAQRDLPAAGRTLESAIAQGIDSPDVYAELAEIYEASGHVENAIPAMRLALDKSPENERFHFRYAMLLIDTKAPQAAVIRTQEALKRQPDSARLWFALGLAYFADTKNQDAAAAFDKAIALDPRFAPALAYRGLAHFERGEYQEALQMYSRALKKDPKIPALHYLIAEAMQKISPESDDVEAPLTRAIALDPTFTRAHLSLGKLYLRQQHFTQAAKEFERVTELDPNAAEAYYQLGRTYTRLKRTADAQRSVAKYEALSQQQRNQAVTDRQELVSRLAKVRF